MQGGLHPDLKIDWHEKMLRGIKAALSESPPALLFASEIIAIAEYSELRSRDTILRLRDAGLDSIPGGGAEILDDEVRYKIARLKCLTEDWINVHRTAHQIGMRTTATMMFGVGENYEHRINHFQKLYELQEETGGFTAFIPWSFQPQEHCARRSSLGRSDCGRISEGAGHLAPVSFELPQRAIQLGHAGIEGLPDGIALRRQRCRLGDARRERGSRRWRDQLHHRRRIAPHHPRRRIPSCTAGYALPAIFSELIFC